MGLDDIAQDAKEDQKEKETEDVAEKLGIKDKEDLERLDDRLNRILNIVTKLDNDVNQLEEEIGDIKTITRELRRMQSGEEDDTSGWNV